MTISVALRNATVIALTEKAEEIKVEKFIRLLEY